MKRLGLIGLLIFTNYLSGFTQKTVGHIMGTSKRGINLYENGDFIKAKVTFDSLILDPDADQFIFLVPEVYYYRAKCDIELGFLENICDDLQISLDYKINGAFALFRQYCSSSEIQKFESESLSDIGTDLFWEKKYREAIPYFTKAIDLNPESFTTLGMRAFSYQQINQLDSALLDYNRLIEINWNPELYYPSRGFLLLDLGKYEESISDFNKAIIFDKDDISSLQGRGQALMALGKYREAIDDFNLVEKQFPSGFVYLDRAKAYLGLGDYKSACKDLNKIKPEELTDEGRGLLKNCK